MRPDFSEISTGNDFNQWYWLKKEMMAICKMIGLPATGSKFTLRDRIMYALDNEGALLPLLAKSKPTSKFNWSKEEITLDTLLTDSVNFGPNFAQFMENQIGKYYSCNIDFMDWARANSGKSMRAAIAQWHAIEKRKKDPRFQSTIAQHNMLNKYVRDFMKTFPDVPFKQVLAIWKIKKSLPMKNGSVRFEQTDINLK